MLEGLDNYDWTKLEHAYGPAKDVPDALRGFPKQTRQGTDHCLDILYAEVYKHGKRFTSTPIVVPFLFEIIADTSLKKREEIVKYLAYVAVGPPDRLLPKGVDTVHWRNRDFADEKRKEEEAEAEEAEIRRVLGQEEEEEDPRFIPDDKIKVHVLKREELLDLYDKVKEGIPVVSKLLEEVENNDMIKNTSYVLGMFPEAADISVPRIITALETCKHVEGRCALLLALGLVWRYNFHNNKDPSLLDRYLTPDTNKWIQCAAAIAYVTCCGVQASVRSVEVLSKLVTDHHEYRQMYRWELPFDDGRLSNYAIKTLALLNTESKEHNDALVPPLVESLKKDLIMEQAMTVSEAILSLIFDTDHIENEKKLEDLNELQIDALKAIACCDGWGKQGMLFGNYMSLMRSYGLPEARADLKKILLMPVLPGEERQRYK